MVSFECSSLQVYNMFPWIGPLVKNQKLFQRLFSANKKQNLHLFAGAKKMLNPQMCRSFVDAFLVRQQSLEVTTLFPSSKTRLSSVDKDLMD